MSPETRDARASADIQPGNTCLLSFYDHHYMVRIIEVGQDTVRLSFPGKDYPIEGLDVDLEFHDHEGLNRYPVRVIKGPLGDGEGILVQKPARVARSQHREHWRIFTDLTAQVKEQIHIRRYDAGIVNLSQGGALLTTQAPFEIGATIELTLSLPGHPSHTILARIMHISDLASSHGGEKKLLGIRFIGLDRSAQKCVVEYIWHQMKQPKSFASV